MSNHPAPMGATLPYAAQNAPGVVSYAFQTQDEWAKARMDYIIGFLFANHASSDKPAPPQAIVDELATLTREYTAAMAAKEWESARLKPDYQEKQALANGRLSDLTDAVARDCFHNPTGKIPGEAFVWDNGMKFHDREPSPGDAVVVEPIQLSELPGFNGPATQIQAEPWLVIIRHNGHAYRVWVNGRVEYSGHPDQLFTAYLPLEQGRATEIGQREPHMIWLSVGGYRWTIYPLDHRVERMPLDAFGHNAQTGNELVSADALTWWPG